MFKLTQEQQTLAIKGLAGAVVLIIMGVLFSVFGGDTSVQGTGNRVDASKVVETKTEVKNFDNGATNETHESADTLTNSTKLGNIGSVGGDFTLDQSKTQTHNEGN